ncbi:hypothetical protein NUSPORA_00084 [Nucleospora cyclopteri]
MEVVPGTILSLYHQQTENPLSKEPVVQITAANRMVTQDGKVRYKINISDGKHFMKCIFSSDISAQIDSGTIQVKSIVKITSYSHRQKDTTVYLLVSALGGSKNCDEIIGNPTSILSKTENSVQKTEKQVQKQPADHEKINKKRKITSDTDGKITKIKDINPFLNNWKIKGRVVAKTDIRKFNTKNGEGKVFSFEILDQTMQCKVTSFGEIVDIFFPLIENNKIYSISQGTVKMANKQYTSNNFDYEIYLEKNSLVTLENDAEMPEFCFNFRNITEITPADKLVDVVGVVKEIYAAVTVQIKSTGKETSKRDFILVDPTGSIRVTLWGAKAEEECARDTLVCLKGFKVQEYQGVNLSSVSSSQILQNYNVPEALEIMAWYEKEGKELVIEKPKSVQKRQLISDVLETNSEYANIQATVIYIKEDNLFYPSCPGENCNKKVQQEENGAFRCEKCNFVYDHCNYRYMISANVCDFSGQTWVTLFDDCGKKIFGVEAKQLVDLKDEDPDELAKIVKSALGKEVFMRIRVRETNYNEEIIKRVNCMDISPIDVVLSTQRMLEMIEKAE